MFFKGYFDSQKQSEENKTKLDELEQASTLINGIVGVFGNEK